MRDAMREIAEIERAGLRPVLAERADATLVVVGWACDEAPSLVCIRLSSERIPAGGEVVLHVAARKP